ncbi:MAG: TrkH family potassium uptake protein [Gammaproteobacteria bacterium]|jgi:trk system potassium uptake protein TrkH|uniref:TrkH family potassium uptake protein n=1 Tax=Methylotuvimicrobium sp. TaxID=2822413 RepID=UPI001D9A327E|nr:TrkH family potassium uptake protein [Gammaproteobacteria bacterium]
MQAKVVLRSIGLLLMMFSTTLFLPLLVSYIYQDQAELLFWQSFLILLGAGAMLWFPFRNEKRQLYHRDGFLIVALFWMILGTMGAVPFILGDTPSLSITDAVFESVSGFTTTGATILEGLDDIPKSILFYRQLLQWFGGMGVIVLALAVLPVLGIGGMQLFRAEVPGPVKDSKLTPRIAGTAKALWVIYLGITIICAIAYRIAGMDWFDAIGHSFSTTANGGYSTHDESIGFFKNPAIEIVAIFFMAVSGMNFALHFAALQSASLKVYLLDSEARTYLLLMILSGSVVGGVLYYKDISDFSLFDAMRHGMFQIVSFMTTSGFSTTDFYNWPGPVPVMLVFIGFVGGCAGSTAGGLKVIRVMLLYKQGDREIQRLIHPNACIPVKVGKEVQQERIIEAVWGFFGLYVVSFGIIMLLMMAGGLDQVTAFSAVAACINNVGPGLGDVATSFRTVSDPVKWLACFAMLLGRLEIFTILVLLSPKYWRY